MASLSSGLNANVVKPALDKVFEQEFNGDEHPNVATAENPQVFNQLTADNSAIIWEQFKGIGNWEERKEEQDVAQKTPRVGNTKTWNVVNYAASVDIPKNFYDDDMHDVVNMMVRNFARRGKTTKNINAFAPFRNGFSGELCADGVAWFSDSHTTLSGDTIDNLMTGGLSPTNLYSLVQMLFEQKAQDGVIDGQLAAVLVVPAALWKSAVEITESTLEAHTLEHQLNVYSAKFGLFLATSPYLGSAAGGSETAYFLLAKTHSLNRFVRQAVQTELIPWQNQRNNNYIYKGEYRETVGVMSYEGSAASQGTT